MKEYLKGKNQKSFQHGKKELKEVWHTTIRRNLKVGDKLILGTVFGKAEFEVVSINNDGALIESNQMQARLKKQGKYAWRYNNLTWNKNDWTTITLA